MYDSCECSEYDDSISERLLYVLVYGPFSRVGEVVGLGLCGCDIL